MKDIELKNLQLQFDQETNHKSLNDEHNIESIQGKKRIFMIRSGS